MAYPGHNTEAETQVSMHKKDAECEVGSIIEQMESKGQAAQQHETFPDGPEHYKKLGWKQLAVCLVVESVALGALSMPSVFARVGMVAGVLMTVGLGLIAIYTGYICGQVKLKYPHVMHYSDAVTLIWGRWGYELTSIMFVLLLALTTGSHALTGTITFIRIIDDTKTCALVWGVISGVVLFLLALPPTFHKFAILGYIDFVSIVAAIFICMVATGIQASEQPGGISGASWSMWPPEGHSFASYFSAATNIIFAFSFCVAQFSFMSEMHTPTDYTKSIISLGVLEIIIYTCTGAIIYAFVGVDVASPALLSASKTVSRVAFGVAIPVVFISGSLNTIIVARYIMDRTIRNPELRYVKSRRSWLLWVTVVLIVTVLAWIVAEAIPFFNDLLGMMAAMFISGFSFYFPALFWFLLLKEGKWYQGYKNIMLSVLNGLILVVGLILLGCGTYANIQSIIDNYRKNSLGGSFTCNANVYV